MSFPRVFICCGLFLATLSSGVLALERGENNSALWLMAKYDTNGDNVISIDEISHKRGKLFAYMDADQDGSVSFSEYQGLDIDKRHLLLQARFNKLDLDRDGELNTAEYIAFLGSFDRFDTDGDGRISAADMRASEAAVREADESETYCLLWLCFKSTLD